MHEMRRKDRELEMTDINNILEKCQYGVLSTIGEDGFPYGVPVSYAFEEGKIYFHCAKEGHKLKNIDYCNKASFCVVGEIELLPEKFSTKYESVIAFGNLREAEGDEKVHGFIKILEKYSPDFMEQGKKYIEASGKNAKVFCFEIENVTGKARR